MSAGRHSHERVDRMPVMAEGVKGLLIMRRESWVVRALRMAEASRRSCRGFGESVWGIWGVVELLEFRRAFSKLWISAVVESMKIFNAASFSAFLVVAIQ